MAKLTKKQVESIPEKYKTKTSKEIAIELGVHHRTVEYWIKRWREKGVDIPKKTTSII